MIGQPRVVSSTLRIGSALSDGIDSLTTRGGARLVAAYVVLQVIVQVAINSLFATTLADQLPAEAMNTAYPLALDVPLAVSGLVTVLALVATMLVSIVAMRALYADLDEVPNAQHTRRLPRTLAVLILVSLITGVAIGIGFVFLVIPGIFLAVALVFTQLAVVVEEAGVVEAMKRSWSLTKGNRIRLFALGLIVAVVSGIVGALFGLLGVVSPAVGNLVSAAMTGVASLFGLAVLVSAYQQITDVESATTQNVADLAD